MGVYLLKRIIWIIPTLWFIASAVFILSKLIPGSGASIFEDDPQVRSTIREQVYKQYLQKTGQNLPLFYTSVHSMAEPDTLYRITSYRDKHFLKQLLFQYGNWPAVANYFHHIKALQKASTMLPGTQEQRYFNKLTELLYAKADRPAVLKVFSTLKKFTSSTSGNTLLSNHLTHAHQSFIQLTKHARPISKYLPVLHWHGSQNQYHQWFVKLITGDMGISLRDARPVSSIIGEAISNTLLLSVCSLVLVFGIAVLINLLITHQDYQKLNKLVLNVVYVLDAIPVFLLAFFLIILLATGDYLQLFPVYGLGRLSPESGWLEALFMQLQHLIIPVTCLTLAHIPYVTSQLQQAMWEVTSTDYITTARAKGVPEGNIVRKHIFRNSLFPLITLFSAFIPALLGGAVVIEVIFAIPGMGRLLVDSIQARDYPVILGIVLVMAFARIAANILADILYYLADPRVTFAHDRRSR